MTGICIKRTFNLSHKSIPSGTILLLGVFILLFCEPHALYAAPVTTTTQEEEEPAPEETTDEQKNTKSSLATGQQFINFMSTYFKPITSNTNLFFTGGMVFTLSTGDHFVCAPSPLHSTIGVGYSFHIFQFLLFQPRLTGWSQYYLWNEDTSYAYPAEVENRTATAITLLIDLPLIIPVGTSKNMTGFGLGFGFLPRYSFLSNGVSSDDTGTSGTAQSDVSNINDWFWSDVRYLYPEASLAYIHLLSNGWRLGLEARFYLPLGSLISGNGMDGMIVSTSIRLVLPE